MKRPCTVPYAESRKSVLPWIVVFSIVLLPLSASYVYSAEMTFVDKTVEAGLSYLPSPSYGVSWGDFNNDNLDDILIKNHNTSKPSLYKNMGNGVFEDVTDQAGLNIIADYHGASWGDFDNDGDLDLYQTLGACGGKGIKANYFFVNNGNGTFTNRANWAGLEDPLGRGRTPLWFDFNNDGRLDLFVGNEERLDAASVLFRNNGIAPFTDVTGIAGLANIGDARGTYLIDMNRDRASDLIVTNPNEIQVYLNHKDGTFQEMLFSGKKLGITDLALGDYDNDGNVDVLVTSGLNWGYDAYESDVNNLYYQLINKSAEKGFDFDVTGSNIVNFDFYRFENRMMTTELIYIGAGKYHPDKAPFSLDAASVQNQGEPLRESSGIYIWFDVTDSRWHIRHFVFEKQSDPLSAIVSTSGNMGLITPINLDVIPNDYYKITLLKNKGDGQFIDATEAAGLRQETGFAQSAVFEDFDNDGDLDLYVVCTGPIFNRANKLFENDGAGHFIDRAEQANAEAFVQGRGESVAVADYNNDGFPDIMITNGMGTAPFNAGQRVLLENQGNNNNWLQVKLVGLISNKDAVGSIATVHAGTSRLVRQQTGGMHTFSQNSQILQFGLAEKTIVDKILVQWPSGIRQQLSNIQVNQRLVIEEPKISLNLTPDAVTVSPGNVLGIKIKVKNNTNEYRRFFLATNVTLPNGDLYPKTYFGPAQLTLSPYQTQTLYITHAIPAGAPYGLYKYRGYVGTGPGAVWNEDDFDFSVMPSSSVN